MRNSMQIVGAAVRADPPRIEASVDTRQQRRPPYQYGNALGRPGREGRWPPVPEDIDDRRDRASGQAGVPATGSMELGYAGFNSGPLRPRCTPAGNSL
jgi:hypothetical protein